MAIGRWTTCMHSFTSARWSWNPEPTARSSAASTRPISRYSSTHNLGMESPLTPLEFARRARKLYGQREAVVDGDLRLTYEEFFDRCDRWSAERQGMGVKKGDRVAY